MAKSPAKYPPRCATQAIEAVASVSPSPVTPATKLAISQTTVNPTIGRENTGARGGVSHCGRVRRALRQFAAVKEPAIENPDRGAHQARDRARRAYDLLDRAEIGDEMRD